MGIYDSGDCTICQELPYLAGPWLPEKNHCLNQNREPSQAAFPGPELWEVAIGTQEYKAALMFKKHPKPKNNGTHLINRLEEEK